MNNALNTIAINVLVAAKGRSETMRVFTLIQNFVAMIPMPKGTSTNSEEVIMPPTLSFQFVIEYAMAKDIMAKIFEYRIPFMIRFPCPDNF
jgi:hypothetical protein